jgi:hypothetical protein
MFNFLTIAILFPLECASGFLAFVTSELTIGTSRNCGHPLRLPANSKKVYDLLFPLGADTSGHDHWEGPIKKVSQFEVLSHQAPACPASS